MLITAPANTIRGRHATVARATTRITIACYVAALALVLLPESMRVSAAGKWVFISEFFIISTVIGIPRLLVTAAFAGTLRAALSDNHDAKNLLYAARAAAVFVVLPDIGIAITLLMRGLEQYCSYDGGMILQLCPSSAERPACIAFAPLWLLKGAVTALAWRAVESLPKIKD